MGFLDVHKEEKMAELFAENIMYAGDKFIKINVKTFFAVME